MDSPGDYILLNAFGGRRGYYPWGWGWGECTAVETSTAICCQSAIVAVEISTQYNKYTVISTLKNVLNYHKNSKY